MTKLEYHAAYYQIEDGWYMSEVIDFPGVISQGRTLRSTRRMIRHALRDMAEWYLDEGRPLPTPDPKAKPTEGKPAFREGISLSFRARTGAIK
jgi:predicted RNase H-like HicB family nuclease